MRKYNVLTLIAGLIAAFLIVLLFAKSPEERASMGTTNSSVSVGTTLKAELLQEFLQHSVRIFSNQSNQK